MVKDAWADEVHISDVTVLSVCIVSSIVGELWWGKNVKGKTGQMSVPYDRDTS